MEARIMEVDKIRRYALQHIPENYVGLDIGFGGNPITSRAITLDLPEIYCKPGPFPQHIIGDGRNLSIFADNSLDYVFSSHLLEDFENTEEILIEWLRVIKPYGKLILYLPNEKKYRAFCKRTGRYQNLHHKIEDMSLDYILKILAKLQVIINEAWEEKEEDQYSFFLVAEKF